MVTILIICGVIAALAIGGWILFLIAAFSAAPFVPISKSLLQTITADALGIGEGSVLYDLGCGDGRLLRFGAERHPNAAFIGIEKNLMPYAIAKFRTRKLPNVTIIRGDLYAADISNATHVYAYLFPSLMPKVLEKLQRELKPGGIAVSCDFRMEAKEPARIIRTGRRSGLGGMIFIYSF